MIVTDTCLDERIPKGMLGYPRIENYCRGGIGLTLTGVNSKDGKPVMKSGKKTEIDSISQERRKNRSPSTDLA